MKFPASLLNYDRHCKTFVSIQRGTSFEDLEEILEPDELHFTQSTFKWLDKAFLNNPIGGLVKCLIRTKGEDKIVFQIRVF